MIVSAQELCRTRTCIAANCGLDAEPSGYCASCERKRRRGVEVPLHRVEQPRAPNPLLELWCPGCPAWLPDAKFGHSKDAEGTSRRGRRGECLQCASKRRARSRAAMTPEALQLIIERDHARWQRRRDRERAQKDTA